MPDVDGKKVASTTEGAAENDQREATRQFLATALERWRLAQDAESTIRKDMVDDFEFSVGDQWPSDIKTSRNQDSRPCLTLNRLPQFIRQVTNDQRQNRPAVKVSPVGSGSDVQTAEILQGVIRSVEVNSDADVAYDTAFDHCVRGGRGYWRLVTEYDDLKPDAVPDAGSFNQNIYIRALRNPFAVFMDPMCAEADCSDARWAFIIEDIDARVYREQYPDSSVASLNLMESMGNQPAGWMSKDSVRVAEYFRVEESKRRILKLKDGFVIEEDTYKVLRQNPAAQVPEVAAYRDVLDRRVLWAKINALEILEQNEWPGAWIPIVRVSGDDTEVNGRRYVAGLIRYAKEPQRMYNYWISAATEAIALAPKSPWIVAEGQLEGQEIKWDSANTKNWSYLTYKPVTVAGQMAGPPQRNSPGAPIQDMVMMTRQADNDLKATTGLYDASLGERGPEQSGRAILARQRQGNLATLNFSDNLNRAIRFSGRQILDLIPKIYDVPRILRIIKPDATEQEVAVFNSKLSQMSTDEALQTLNNPALARVYDVGVGKYNVAIGSGPSYQTKRQEAMESMTAMVQAYPNLVPLVGDLLVAQMDWPYAQEIAARLKVMLPPQLQALDSSGDPRVEISKLQGQLKQVMDQHDLLTKALNQATDTIHNKRLELESRERIAALQTQAQLLIEEGKIRGEAALSILTAKIQDIQQRLMVLGEARPVTGSADAGEGGPPQPGAPPAMGSEGIPGSPEPPNAPPESGGEPPANEVT